MEIGCREGNFLKVLKDHGAIVVGSTSNQYIAKARIFLGKNNLVSARAEEAGNHKRLQAFKPDFIVSLNLFDVNRWTKKPVPYRQLYRSLRRLTSKNTVCYVTPSADFYSVLETRNIRRVRGIIDFKKTKRRASKMHTRTSDTTWRFKVRRRA